MTKETRKKDRRRGCYSVAIRRAQRARRAGVNPVLVWPLFLWAFLSAPFERAILPAPVPRPRERCQVSPEEWPISDYERGHPGPFKRRPSSGALVTAPGRRCSVSWPICAVLPRALTPPPHSPSASPIRLFGRGPPSGSPKTKLIGCRSGSDRGVLSKPSLQYGRKKPPSLRKRSPVREPTSRLTVPTCCVWRNCSKRSPEAKRPRRKDRGEQSEMV